VLVESKLASFFFSFSDNISSIMLFVYIFCRRLIIISIIVFIENPIYFWLLLVRTLALTSKKLKIVTCRSDTKHLFDSQKNRPYTVKKKVSFSSDVIFSWLRYPYWLLLVSSWQRASKQSTLPLGSCQEDYYVVCIYSSPEYYL
jgi:hypothetical protein